MRIRLDSSTPLNLDATLCCGQTFRWNKEGEWWYGVAKDKAFKIGQYGNVLEFENVDENFVRNYFSLEDNLPKIYAKISRDKHIKQAVQMFQGLRILHQDPWECLISYICATYKNVQAIKLMLLRLSCRFGEKTCFEQRNFYLFPSPEKLAKVSISEMAECGLGYRAKYVKETAKAVYEKNFDFEQLSKKPYDKARQELLNFSGVGLKVADCVLLFSLAKTEAFPVDVWIKRVILEYYSEHFPEEFVKKIFDKRSPTNTEYERLSLFGREYFGEYAGYAQEYLYHYERTKR